MSEDKVLVKSSFWYTVGNFLSRTLVFLATPIYIRFLTTAEYGMYSNFVSWMSMLSIVTCMNLQGAIFKGQYDYEDNIDGYIKSVLIVMYSVVTVVLIAVLLGYNQIKEFMVFDNIQMILLFLYLYSYPAFQIYTGKLRSVYKIKNYLIATIVHISSTVIVSLGLMLIFDSNQYLALLFGQVIPMVVISFVLLFKMFSKKGKIEKTHIIEAYKIGLPMIPHLIGVMLLSKLDRIMITQISGPEENAYYSVAGNVNAIAAVVATSLNNAFVPWMTQALENKDFEDAKRNGTINVLIFSVIILGAMLVSPEIVWFFGGDSYNTSLLALIPLLLGTLFQFIYTLYVNLEFYARETAGIGMATGTIAMVNAALNYIFISKYGFVAAAYTTAFSYLLLLFIHWAIVNRINMGYVFDNKKFLMIIILMTILSVAVNILFSYLVLRYFVVLFFLLALGFILYKNKELIVALFK